MLSRVFVVTLCTLLTVAALSQTHPSLLLVANQEDRTLSIIDASSGRQIAAVPESGITGHEVGVDPDTRTAFVPIYGNSGVGKPGTDGSTIDVVDLGTGKRTSTIDLGHRVRPHNAVWEPHQRLLYVTTELDQSVSILDPRTLRIVGSIPTGAAESHMLAISHDGRRGYTANVGPGTVSVLDLQARKTLAIIPVVPGTQRISISMDDRTVFTADQGRPRLALIDTASRMLKAWVSLPSTAYGTAPTLDGRWLLVTLPALNQVAVLDLETMKIARTFDVSRHPSEVMVRPDGKAAYVSCMDDGEVAVIELTGAPSTWTVGKPIKAGRAADGLAWAP